MHLRSAIGFAPNCRCSSTVAWPPEKAYLLIFFCTCFGVSVTKMALVGSLALILPVSPWLAQVQRQQAAKMVQQTWMVQAIAMAHLQGREEARQDEGGLEAAQLWRHIPGHPEVWVLQCTCGVRLRTLSGQTPT